jgi:RNA polymerase sigma factor (sigma-70 family)
MATAAPRTDAALIRRLRARDRAAWEELYAEHGPGLHRFALRLARNEHDAADLVQETFVRALPRLDRLDPDTTELGAYLFTTLRNLFLKSVERGKRVQPVEDVPEPVREAAPIEDDPERSALLVAQQRELRAANGRLSQRQRLVLALRELEDKSYAEIGELVGLNENAVAQLVFRARESLRTELRLAQVDPERLPEPCRSFLPLLATHLDGQLKGTRREEVLGHLDGCATCQASLESMDEAKRRYRTVLLPLGAGEEVARAADRELEAAGYWTTPHRPAGARRRRLRDATLIAAGALALGAGGLGAAALLESRDDLTAAPSAPATTALRATTVAPAPPPPAPAPAPAPAAPITITLGELPEPPAAEQPPAPPAQTAAAEPPPAAAKAPPPPAAVTQPPGAMPGRTTAPPASTTATTATFSFAANEGGVTYSCALDGAAFAACTSPTVVSGVAVGNHVFAVRATDAAGNVGAAAQHAWRVNLGVVLVLPDLVIASLTKNSVVVRNAGAATAGPSTLTITLIGTFSIEALAPGQSATRTWSICRAGTLTARADRTNVVVESNEDNNTASITSTCR